MTDTPRDPIPLTVPEAFLKAVDFQKDGQEAAAEQLYRMILTAEPDHTEANHNLGMLLLKQRRASAALPFFAKAFDTAPDDDRICVSYAIGLSALGRDQDALDIVEPVEPEGEARERLKDLRAGIAERQKRAAAAQGDGPPQSAVAEAVSALAEGDFETALGHATKLTENWPAAGIGWHLKGAALQALGRTRDAAAALQLAVRHSPERAASHSALGLALAGIGQAEAAEAAHRQAHNLDPQDIDITANLAVHLVNAGKPEEAVGLLDGALKSAPERHDIRLERAKLYFKAGDPAAALRLLKPAMPVYETDSDALTLLGEIAKRLRVLNQAVAYYRKALDADPNNAKAKFLLGFAYRDLGRMDEAEATYRDVIEQVPANAAAHASLLFAMGHNPRHGPQDLFEAQCAYGRNHSAEAPPKIAPAGAALDPDRKLRLGILASGYGRNPERTISWPMLSRLDPERYELVFFLNGQAEDDLTKMIKARAKGWHFIGRHDDDAAAEIIAGEQVDMLFDLPGHILNGRLPIVSRRPAPVQVNPSCGPGSSGMVAMDAMITDGVLVGKGDERYYTETIYRVPGTVFSTDPDAVPGPPAKAPVTANGYVTFCNFNRFSKLTPATLKLHAKVLKAVPDSRLLINEHALAVKEMQDHITTLFNQAGVDNDRLIFFAAKDHRELLAAHNHADIALDPVPFVGGMIARDGLQMGVPLITLKGSTYVGRMASSMMTGAGYGEWIAESEDAYVAKAVELAADHDALAKLRLGLQKKVLASPLFRPDDGPAAEWESILRRIWSDYCSRAAH